MSLPFVGISYSLANRKASIQRAVNLYLVGLETPSKEPFIMDSVPGLSVFADGGAVIRGAYTAGSRSFFVAGSTLYEFTAAAVLTSRGTLVTSSGVVDFAHGTSQLVMVDGPNGYVLTLATSALARITDPDFPGSKTVRFLDNFFLFIHPTTQQAFISAINDASNFDALDFASAESAPDNLVGQAVVGERWLQFGELTLEVHRNAGTADYPFERSQGTTIQVGCQAVYSIQEADTSVIWLGQDKNGGGMIYRYVAGVERRISTTALEQVLATSTDLSAARAYTYQDKGLTFYCFNAPGLAATWAYEISTGQWAERADLDSVGQFKAHRGTCHVFAFGKHLLGADDGKLYQLDRTVYTNAGDPLVCERTSPNDAQPGLTNQFFPEFFADVTTGEAPQGVADPQWELSWSGDAGATWSNPVMRSAGSVGKRYTRLHWARLGGGREEDRDRVWRLRCSANAPKAINNAGARVVPGTS